MSDDERAPSAVHAVPDAPAPDPAEPGGRAGRLAFTAFLLLLSLAYAAWIYYGIGPQIGGAGSAWWRPSGALLDSALIALFPSPDEGGRPENVLYAMSILALPALILAILICGITRSALMRWLAVSSVLAILLFCFYGISDRGPQIWIFFRWRASAVLVSLALLVGAAFSAPWLGRSWLRRSLPLRIVIALALIVGVVLLERSATGTNEALPFSISPWPVLTVFGLDLITTLWLGLLASVTLGLAAWRARGRSAALAALGLVLALAVPVLWVTLRLPSGLPLLSTTAALAMLALWIGAGGDGGGNGGWASLARSSAGGRAAGVLLFVVPLLCAHTWIRLDYAETRGPRAQKIIGALGRYYERESLYPETLGELVESRDLDEIPRPRIGFAFLEVPAFSYQNFGTDYLLEFSAPGWVQCAFNPPWESEDGAGSVEPKELEPEDDGWLPGSWSCPAKPPELW